MTSKCLLNALFGEQANFETSETNPHFHQETMVWGARRILVKHTQSSSISKIQIEGYQLKSSKKL